MTAPREPVVVDVLTGFLGAGKTTLLNRLLRLPELGDAAVLVNEFGDVGVDHLLVEKLEEDIVLLRSGCICCTIRGDLKGALVGLLERLRRSGAPPFRRIVIETTGLADPTPILSTVTGDVMLRHQLRMGRVIAVVDAPGGARNLADFEVCARQAAAADVIALTKTDLAPVETTAALRGALARLNPDAAVVVPADDAALASLLEAAGPAIRSPAPDARASHAVVAPDVRSLTIETADSVDWRAFALWLSMLAHRHGPDLLRIKGLVAVRDVETPVVVHGVQRMIHQPRHLPDWPDSVRRTRLVLIVRGLDAGLIRRSFRTLVEAAAAPVG